MSLWKPWAKQNDHDWKETYVYDYVYDHGHEGQKLKDWKCSRCGAMFWGWIRNPSEEPYPISCAEERMRKALR